MAKDYKEIFKSFYKQDQSVINIVTVPPFYYLQMDGHGRANTLQFNNALTLLCTISYTIKLLAKEAGNDFAIMPFEALWYRPNNILPNKNGWHFTVLMMQPECVNAKIVTTAKAKVAEKNPQLLVDRVRYELLDEGCCVQAIHSGSKNQEYITIMAMHQHASEHGYILNGKHHKIYLSDPRYTPPAEMQTILRQPIRLM